MLHFMTGDIFDSPAHTLVNPVNCVGVMGAGLALEFKKRFPQEFKNYVQFCRSGNLHRGKCLMLTTSDEYNPYKRMILAAATKGDWRYPSRLDDIESVIDMIAAIAIANPLVKSIAIPKLGCGCGGLDWKKQVRPLMVKYLASNDIPIDIYVFE